jgi:hypothetical protein
VSTVYIEDFERGVDFLEAMVYHESGGGRIDNMGEWRSSMYVSRKGGLTRDVGQFCDYRTGIGFARGQKDDQVVDNDIQSNKIQYRSRAGKVSGLLLPGVIEGEEGK